MYTCPPSHRRRPSPRISGLCYGPCPLCASVLPALAVSHLSCRFKVHKKSGGWGGVLHVTNTGREGGVRVVDGSVWGWTWSGGWSCVPRPVDQSTLCSRYLYSRNESTRRERTRHKYITRRQTRKRHSFRFRRVSRQQAHLSSKHV